jgi:hypothetical protein
MHEPGPNAPSDGAAKNQRPGACVACREPIHREARICPHCRSAQSRDPWSRAAVLLKWTGGVTAVASLLLTLNQVQAFLDGWRERHAAVGELVRAARMEMDAGDYAGSFSLYQEALQIEQGSRAARDGQLQTAMRWLRDIRVTGPETFTAAVERLLPILYRGAAKDEARLSADALAHIGWADYLRTREGKGGLDVERSFAEAVRRDLDNPYAHAMWGFWILYRHGDAAEARRQFAQALQGGRDARYVRTLQIWALVNAGDLDSRVELVKVLDELRKSGQTLDLEQRRRAFEVVYRADESRVFLERCTALLSAQEQLATLRWLYEEEGGFGFRRHRDFYLARLTEATGDAPSAARVYRSLLESASLEPELRDQVTEALARVSARKGESRP